MLTKNRLTPKPKNRLTPKHTSIKRQELSEEQCQAFSNSSFDNPVPAKEVKDFISPLARAMANKKIRDVNNLYRVFVALPAPTIAIMECGKSIEEMSEFTLAQSTTIADIRKYWGSASSAIRIKIPLLIDIPDSDKKILFYRAPNIQIHGDIWVDGFFSKKYSTKTISRISNRLIRTERKLTSLEEGIQDIKNMIHQQGINIPERIRKDKIQYERFFKVSEISPNNPDASYCSVKLQCNFSFRMEPFQNDRWIPCSNLKRIDDGSVYPHPSEFSDYHIKKILASLYDCNDPALISYMEINPDIESFIID